MYKHLITVLLIGSSLFAQTENSTVYEIPFASCDNSIELDIVNSGVATTENIVVKILNKPDWILMNTIQQSPGKISAADEKPVSFLFDVEMSAPVGIEEKIVFEISNGTEHWQKEINLKVLAPMKLELINNYPNPFNPETTIGFTLPQPGKVKLEIYNMLGQKVTRLMNSNKKAGYHYIKWNAQNYASGIYIYRIQFTDTKGNQIMKQKKLTLLR